MKYALLLAAALVCATASAQFSNRYPKVQGLRHHIYLEGYDFPFYSNGPVSPVASPAGGRIAFSAYGWIWLLDESSGVATRLTHDGENDFLPAWSPDGRELVFVRDTGTDTKLMRIKIDQRQVSVLVDFANSSELDPRYSPDGQFVYFTSSSAGTFDVWRVHTQTLATERITKLDRQQEMRPVPVRKDGSYFYISKAGAVDQIRFYDAATGQERSLEEGRIASQLWMDTDTQGEQLFYTFPTETRWELFASSPSSPGAKIKLFSEEWYAIEPAYDTNNRRVLFSVAGSDHRFRIMQVPVTGGAAREVAIGRWDWDASTQHVTVRLVREGSPVPARVTVRMENGHNLIPAGAIARFDSQQGEVFFYAEGSFELDVPSGKIEVRASHGLLDRGTTGMINPSAEIGLTLSSEWKKPGWYAGDHHFHLNYGGPFKLNPEDLVPILRAEAIDFATPMSANLHTALKDQEYMNWHRDELPMIRFGQEVRSHFHGHIGLFGRSDLFWPWFWGPLGYEVRAFDDRPNSEVLAFARNTGYISTYVHPIEEDNPAANDETLGRMPIELVADAVNGELDGLEVACLWSNEMGSSVAYHHLLNLGIPIVQTAGTDAFPGFARSMAVGTTRLIVRSEKPDWETYLQAIRDNHSYVTSGPMLDFTVEGKGPGDVLDRGGNVKWKLDVASSQSLEQVELICNGKVIWKSTAKAGLSQFSGNAKVPAGGWLSVRVYSAASAWPLMDTNAFAHTSPVWIGQKGSVDLKARKESAAILHKALLLARARMRAAYAGHTTERQDAAFEQARLKLEALLR